MVRKILINSGKEKEWPTWAACPSSCSWSSVSDPGLSGASSAEALTSLRWREPVSPLGTLLGWGWGWGRNRDGEGRKVKASAGGRRWGQPRILLWEFRTTGLAVLITVIIIILATSLAHSPHYCRALKTHKLPWWSWFNPWSRLSWLWSVWSGWC